MTDRTEPRPAAGIVYLVGAGPGDPGLLTCRGREILQECDAIVYDRLAASVVPVDVRPEVELHYVGKRTDHHAAPQEQINALLVRLGGEGKRVCRLKGGDPFVFGRGGEEAEALRAAGVRYEVVPGVTAGVAVPAYAGIPVTHRGEAVRVTLVTAHEAPAKAGNQIDWRCLAADPNGTISAYMPVTNLAAICEILIAHGLDPQTPAAVIERGTLASQRTVTAPLRDLAARSAAEGIRPPAIFIAGRTVALRERLAWFEERPLHGKRVVVTRPADQAGEMIDAVRRLGIEPVVCPVIRTVPAPPAELAPLLPRLGAYDWVFFTSENGVRYFLQMLWELGRDARALCRAGLAAVGGGTAQRLAQFGLRADFLPSAFRGEVLMREFLDGPAREGAPGLRILRVRGDRASTELEEGLRAAGAEVDTALAYRILPAEPRPDVIDAIAADGADAVTFTSGSSVEAFERLAPGHGLHDAAAAVCIGPVTARTAERIGWKRIVAARTSTVAGLVETLAEVLGGSRGGGAGAAADGMRAGGDEG